MVKFFTEGSNSFYLAIHQEPQFLIIKDLQHQIARKKQKKPFFRAICQSSVRKKWNPVKVATELGLPFCVEVE